MPRPLFVPNEHQKIAHSERKLRRLERRSSGPWHKVGGTNPDGTAEPGFQNGWGNVGGSLMELRYRWNLSGGVDIQGSVTGGNPGTVVFSLPPGYYETDGEVRIAAVDDNGNVVVVRIVPATGPARGDVYID